MRKKVKTFKNKLLSGCIAGALILSSCAQVNVPNPRAVDIEKPVRPLERPEAVNEGYEPVIYVPLGKDILIPKRASDSKLPEDIVGPFELRNETLAGALQLALVDYDIPLAFETQEGLSRLITVSNLKGTVDQVVENMCSLANLYCSYENNVLTIKETETFTVTLPPLQTSENDLNTVYAGIVTGLEAITGSEPILDTTTRTLIYTTSNRNAKKAKQYFNSLRGNTAMIVFETYIWEVELSGGNTTGIQWDDIEDLNFFGGFNTGFSIQGAASNALGTPISIGLPTRGNVNLSTGDVLNFLSSQGNVKTISQPQVTVLSGGEVTLRVSETTNYIDTLSRTVDEDGDETVSTTVSSVDSGFTLTIASNWDQSTVYGNFEIELDDLQGFQEFSAGSGETLSLPSVSERDLTTQVRVRPGDSILIAGLVTERDSFNSSGPGFTRALFPTSRTAQTENSELVFLLRPRVIAYVSQEDQKSVIAEQQSRQRKRMNETSVKTIKEQTRTPSAQQRESTDEDLRKAMKLVEEKDKTVEALARRLDYLEKERLKSENENVTPTTVPSSSLTPTSVPVQTSTEPLSLIENDVRKEAPAIQRSTPISRVESELEEVSIPQLPETISATTQSTQTEVKELSNEAKKRMELLDELRKAKASQLQSAGSPQQLEQQVIQTLEQEKKIKSVSDVSDFPIDLLNPGDTQ